MKIPAAIKSAVVAERKNIDAQRSNAEAELERARRSAGLWESEVARYRERRPHEFTALWWHYCPFGPQDVHLHGCFDDDCDRTLVAEGRSCGGSEQPHFRFWLGDDLPDDLAQEKDRREAPLRFYEAAH